MEYYRLNVSENYEIIKYDGNNYYVMSAKHKLSIKVGFNTFKTGAL
jgi:hypothetical protein